MATNNDDNVKGVLVDLTRCIGCRGCQVACKSWNDRSTRKTEMDGTFTNPTEMNSDTYTRISFVESEKDGQPVWSFVKNQCMHCQDPACVSACPVGAFSRTPEGAVNYNYNKCIGCRYCMVACPFGIPKYEWEKIFPWVRKCTFCSDRIAAGKTPACVKTCPTGAMLFGNREDILKEAEKRIKENPGKYVNHIYGKEEAGGTAWVYLSAVPFDQLGFNTKIPNVKLPQLTWNMLGEIPYKVGALVLGLSLIATFRNRGANAEKASESKNEKEK
ncbi:MAG TPA: 4Fe-4S dicluster domain-containing protein [Nitrospirota bacterium]